MNTRKTKVCFVTSGLLLLLFILLIGAVQYFDVQEIGPKNSQIGLATINGCVFDFFGVNLIWYNITDWLGVVAILVAFGFAILGFVQMIRRKGIMGVDADILALGVFYVVVVVLYIFFEVYIVNYRPVILYENLEASFPSSHTMIVLCIMATAMMQFHMRIKKKMPRLIMETLSVLLMVITVFGRLISGVHWFTDILGGILLSMALILIYGGFLRSKSK